jgi:hypothetical protein
MFIAGIIVVKYKNHSKPIKMFFVGEMKFFIVKVDGAYIYTTAIA